MICPVGGVLTGHATAGTEIDSGPVRGPVELERGPAGVEQALAHYRVPVLYVGPAAEQSYKTVIVIEFL